MPRGVPEFLLWCTRHDIKIDERLEIRDSLLDGSLSVFLKANGSVAIGETCTLLCSNPTFLRVFKRSYAEVVQIPKSMVFSVKNCYWSRDIAACHHRDEDPALKLSLAFLLETSVGPESRWYGYFATLPGDIVDIAVFWGVNGDQDGMEAKAWLQGTEAAKILYPPGRLGLLDRVNAYFRSTAEPMLRRLNLPGTLADYHRAYSIVSSRAFLVDAYHGLSLVPVADVFNHVEDNHVHLESDYHVCSTCGSLEECDHDVEIMDKSANSIYGGDETCEMVANLPISPGEELFNTYEKGLTNAELICQYGFTLDVNENNLVSWSIDELLLITAGWKPRMELWRSLVSNWPSHRQWEETQLVFNSRTGDNVNEDSDAKHKRSTYPLDLNADGQISHELWLFLFTLGLPDVDVEPQDALVTAQRTAWTQEQLEHYLHLNLTVYDSSTFEDRGPLDHVWKIAEIAQEICEAKLGSAHCADISAQRIGEILDEMPTDRKLCRRAIVYALEERKMLQTCQTVWSELAGLR